MRRSIFLACVLSLIGCARVSLPADSLDGTYTMACVITGVQHERGEPDEPISMEGSGPLTVENGAIVIIEGCAPLDIVGYDGSAFDIEPATCGEPPREWRIVDAHGSAEADVVTSLTVHFVEGNVPDYWSERTMVCELVR